MKTINTAPNNRELDLLSDFGANLSDSLVGGDPSRKESAISSEGLIIGTTVCVLRSTGYWDENWCIKEKNSKGVRLFKEQSTKIIRNNHVPTFIRKQKEGSCSQSPVSLAEAIRTNEFRIVRIALGRCMDCNEMSEVSGKMVYPLLYACKKGNTAIVRLLLVNGADWTTKNKKGMNSLHVAAKKGKTSIVKSLLQSGADIDCKCDKGKTALIYAMENKKDKTVQFLVNNGSNLSITDNKGDSPLSLAIALGYTQVIDIHENSLIGRSANDQNDENEENETLQTLTKQRQIREKINAVMSMKTKKERSVSDTAKDKSSAEKSERVVEEKESEEEQGTSKPPTTKQTKKKNNKNAKTDPSKDKKSVNRPSTSPEKSRILLGYDDDVYIPQDDKERKQDGHPPEKEKVGPKAEKFVIGDDSGHKLDKIESVEKKYFSDVKGVLKVPHLNADEYIGRDTADYRSRPVHRDFGPKQYTFGKRSIYSIENAQDRKNRGGASYGRVGRGPQRTQMPNSKSGEYEGSVSPKGFRKFSDRMKGNGPTAKNSPRKKPEPKKGFGAQEARQRGNKRQSAKKGKGQRPAEREGNTESMHLEFVRELRELFEVSMLKDKKKSRHSKHRHRSTSSDYYSSDCDCSNCRTSRRQHKGHSHKSSRHHARGTHRDHQSRHNHNEGSPRGRSHNQPPPQGYHNGLESTYGGGSFSRGPDSRFGRQGDTRGLREMDSTNRGGEIRGRDPRDNRDLRDSREIRNGFQFRRAPQDGSRGNAKGPNLYTASGYSSLRRSAFGNKIVGSKYNFGSSPALDKPPDLISEKLKRNSELIEINKKIDSLKFEGDEVDYLNDELTQSQIDKVSEPKSEDLDRNENTKDEEAKDEESGSKAEKIIATELDSSLKNTTERIEADDKDEDVMKSPLEEKNKNHLTDNNSGNAKENVEVKKDNAPVNKPDQTGPENAEALDQCESIIDFLSTSVVQENNPEEVIRNGPIPEAGQESTSKEQIATEDEANTVPTIEHKNQLSGEAQEDIMCCVCLEIKSKTLFLPCKHICCCAQCAEAKSECPICDTQISEKFNIENNL